MTAEHRTVVLFIPLYVAGVSLLGTGLNTLYNVVHDSAHDPCALARDWVVAGKPNPTVAPLDTAELSRRMVRKVEECAR